MLKLLIIKKEDQYIRIKENSFEFCSLEKASVFSMDKLEEVQSKVKHLNKILKTVSISVLEINEYPLNQKKQ